MLFQIRADLLILLALLPSLGFSKTNLSGCVQTTTTVNNGTSTALYFEPCSGEICEVPVCVMNYTTITSNPACSNYSGTSTYSTSYLSGYSTVPGQYAASCLNDVFTVAQTTTTTVMPTTTTPTSGSSEGSGASAAMVTLAYVPSTITTNGSAAATTISMTMTSPVTSMPSGYLSIVVVSPTLTLTSSINGTAVNGTDGNGTWSSGSQTLSSPPSSASEYQGAAATYKAESLMGFCVGVIAAALLL